MWPYLRVRSLLKAAQLASESFSFACHFRGDLEKRKVLKGKGRRAAAFIAHVKRFIEVVN